VSEIASWANPAAGTKTEVLREGGDRGRSGRVLIRTRQATGPILESCHEASRLYDPVNERKVDGGFRWVARLPAVVVMQLNLRGIMQGQEVIDEKRFLMFLDDIDHRRLRCDNGRRLRNLPKTGVV
jgi:hypothetical protein